MPANYTRRRDFFIDAGFADADSVLRALADEVARLGLLMELDTESPEHSMAIGNLRRREPGTLRVNLHA